MLIETNFRADNNNKEILPMNQGGFPYVCMHTELKLYHDMSFPWHWHSAFEIDYIAEGESEFRTSDSVIYLQKGDVVFINSGVMHAYRGKEEDACEIYAHLFDMHFLSGEYNSILEQKYMFPIVKSMGLQALLIRPNSYRRIQMVEAILKITELTKQEPFGYEFEIRAELSRFWCLLLQETEELRDGNVTHNSADAERIKVMMQFIQEHFMERITLDHIAAAADISGRECTRCFQRCIDNSPINYLNTYRVGRAAQMLTETKDSILTISENCGFSTGSYFGKVFHEMMGCTPMEYRKGKKSDTILS